MGLELPAMQRQNWAPGVSLFGILCPIDTTQYSHDQVWAELIAKVREWNLKCQTRAHLGQSEPHLAYQWLIDLEDTSKPKFITSQTDKIIFASEIRRWLAMLE